MREINRFTAVFFGFAVWACGVSKDDVALPGTTGEAAEDPATTSTTAAPAATTTTTMTTTTAGGATTDPAEPGGSSSDTGGGFIGEPDGGGGPSVACDIYAQDCPDGLKCATDTEQWGCVPIPDDPQGFLEECTTDGFADDCDIGLTCTNGPSPDYVLRCYELCGGSEDEPTCSDGNACHPWVPGWPLCHAQCDPVMQDCPELHGCHVGMSEYACLPDHSDENMGGGFGQACLGPWMCAPGLECVSGEAAGCATEGCCTPFCDLDTVNDCPGEGHVCSPLGFGTPPLAVPGLENVGICLDG